MELLQLMLLFLCLIPAAYLCLHKLALKKVSKNSNLPPGSMGWPLIGETLDYYLRFRQGLLYKFVAERLKKYSTSIFRSSLIGEDVVIFSSAEGNKFLFSHEKKFVQFWLPVLFGRAFPKSRTSSKSSAERAYELRNILRLYLKLDVLREYVGFVDDTMKKHLRRDWNSKQVIVLDMVKRYVLICSCNIFLGIKDPRKVDQIGKQLDDIENGAQGILPRTLPGTALNRSTKAASSIMGELLARARQRRLDLSSGYESSSTKDLMSLMLLETDENGDHVFRDEDIPGHLVGLLLGGYSTVNAVLTNIMKYLAELPDVYESVLREQKGILEAKGPNDMLSLEDIRNMKYSWSVACEVMRILPPGFGLFREAIADFTYEGYTIPKGSKIHMTFAATHENPKYFPDPEKFDPSRFLGDGPIPYTFVPFGGGPRMCPGNEYARIVMLVFMHNVVINLRLEKLIPEEKIIYPPIPRPAYGLPVILHAHKH